MVDREEIIGKISSFLTEIGIPINYVEIQEKTFLPGIKIDRGAILVDKNQLKYPGDLLHEAGHVAVMTPEERQNISGDVQHFRPEGQSDELAAILWSYAALIHLEIDPTIVFHPDGYKGESEWLIENLTQGTYIGLPLLVWMQLTSESDFPRMHRWIRP